MNQPTEHLAAHAVVGAERTAATSNVTTTPVCARRKPTLSIVIPVFNEELGIEMLLRRLLDLLRKLGDEAAEVIFVDDHSGDGSGPLLEEVCRKHGQFRYLRLSRNSGSHIAILAGLARAQGECAVFLASDLQDPPELILTMLGQWRAGTHVVWAARERREGVPVSQRILATVFYALLNRFGQISVPPQGADFALLDRKVIDALLVSVGSTPSLGGAIAWLGFHQSEIPYVKQARQFGRSKWTLAKRLRGFADAFVAFSFVPMRLMSYTGMLMALCGFIYAGIVIANRLMTEYPIEGYASLMVVVLVGGGAQMTMLGVLGEYIWRTLEEARRRPLFFVEKQKGFVTATEFFKESSE